MPDHPTPFRCPICRCSQYEVVSVATPRGEIRRTPFYACCGCTVMFRDRFLGSPRKTQVEVRVHVTNPRRHRLLRHRRPELPFALGPVEIVGGRDDAQPGVCLRECRVESDGALQ